MEREREREREVKCELLCPVTEGPFVLDSARKGVPRHKI